MTRSEFVDRVLAVVREYDGSEQECAEALMGMGLGLFEQLGIDIEEIVEAVRHVYRELGDLTESIQCDLRTIAGDVSDYLGDREEER